jgi:catechol 2,3-dioxygenase-like lactoylglutathione lyase family enzyme
LFITVCKVARSRDFYSRVLGGTVVLDPFFAHGVSLREPAGSAGVDLEQVE